MILKTKNNTVKIRITAISNGHIGFSFPYHSIYLYVGRAFVVPLFDKTLMASNRCLQNPYKKKRDCLMQRAFLLLLA
jgi:hypothetical protein